MYLDPWRVHARGRFCLRYADMFAIYHDGVCDRIVLDRLQNSITTITPTIYTAAQPSQHITYCIFANVFAFLLQIGLFVTCMFRLPGI